MIIAASSRSRCRQHLHISVIDAWVTPQSRKANFRRVWEWFSSNCVIKASATTTSRSWILITNDVSGGKENLILASIVARMAGEGDGEELYLAPSARFLKLRSGRGGKTSGRVLLQLKAQQRWIRRVFELTNGCCQRWCMRRTVVWPIFGQPTRWRPTKLEKGQVLISGLFGWGQWSSESRVVRKRRKINKHTNKKVQQKLT